MLDRDLVDTIESNKDAFLAHLDTKAAIPVEERYVIAAPCPVCTLKAQHGCKECVLDKYEKHGNRDSKILSSDDIGCFTIMEYFMGLPYSKWGSILSVSPSMVTWSSKRHAEAIALIQRLKDGYYKYLDMQVAARTLFIRYKSIFLQERFHISSNAQVVINVPCPASTKTAKGELTCKHCPLDEYKSFLLNDTVAPGCVRFLLEKTGTKFTKLTNALCITCESISWYRTNSEPAKKDLHLLRSRITELIA